MGDIWLKTVQLYIIISDVVTIQEPSTSTAQLYDFMLSHANIHNMSSLKMNVVSEEDLVIIPGDKNSTRPLVITREIWKG